MIGTTDWSADVRPGKSTILAKRLHRHDKVTGKSWGILARESPAASGDMARGTLQTFHGPPQIDDT
jgi:hypothetical protein